MMPAEPAVPSIASAPPHAPRSVFSADGTARSDDLAHGPQAGFLAELAAHGAATTPLCIGVFGPAGSGKTSFVATLFDAVRRLSDAAAGAPSPFLSGIATMLVTAEPGVAPATSLMRHVFAALASVHPRLAAEASHAGRDPRTAALDASDKLNEVRQRLDAERHKLDDLSSRHARLTDSVLFESAGSRVDAYGRANRARIDRSLRRFGFDGDSAVAYKTLVREASEPGGSLARGPGWLRAFWAYRGQTRLIVVALGFFVAAWAVGLLMDNQASLIESLRGSGDKMSTTADWAQAHAHWLRPVKEVLALAGLAALAINLLRGFRFLQPIAKGAILLRSDVETRRRDLDGLLGHQTHRVDSLAREAEAASRHAAEAEARLAAGAADAVVALPAPAQSRDDGETARAFFATLAAAVQARAGDRLESSAAAGPSRLVIGIDGLDSLSSEAAADYLAGAHRLLGQAGFVMVVAADPAHLAAGLAETDPALAASRLDRMVQVPYMLQRSEEPLPSAAKLVRSMLDGAGSPERPAPLPDTDRSALDLPWLPSEKAVLEALAPVAAQTPRAIKRFVNLYRVARADPSMRGGTPHDLAALAVGLALQAAGAPLDARNPGATSGLPDAMLRIRTTIGAALGAPFVFQDAGRGFETARAYSAGL